MRGTWYIPTTCAMKNHLHVDSTLKTNGNKTQLSSRQGSVAMHTQSRWASPYWGLLPGPFRDHMALFRPLERQCSSTPSTRLPPRISGFGSDAYARTLPALSVCFVIRYEAVRKGELHHTPTPVHRPSVVPCCALRSGRIKTLVGARSWVQHWVCITMWVSRFEGQGSRLMTGTMQCQESTTLPATTLPSVTFFGGGFTEVPLSSFHRHSISVIPGVHRLQTP